MAHDFGFTPSEQGAFSSLTTKKGEYALALFRTQLGDKLESEVVRIELSPFDYAVATSDKEDNRLLKTFAKKRDLKLIDACAEVSAFAQRNNLFVIDAVKKLLEVM